MLITVWRYYYTSNWGGKRPASFTVHWSPPLPGAWVRVGVQPCCSHYGHAIMGLQFMISWLCVKRLATIKTKSRESHNWLRRWTRLVFGFVFTWYNSIWWRLQLQLWWNPSRNLTHFVFYKQTAWKIIIQKMTLSYILLLYYLSLKII